MDIPSKADAGPESGVLGDSHDDRVSTKDSATHKLLESKLSIEAYDALNRLSISTGRSTDSLLEEFILSRSRSHSFPTPSKAVFEPQIALREAAVERGQTALLFIDVQNFNCHKQGAEYRGQPDVPENDYWWHRMSEAGHVWHSLQQKCRATGIEVMYSVIQSLTADGRDRSLDYKISGFHVPPGSFDSQVLECIQPGPDEIVVPKTSSSVFTTTNIDRLLRNLGVRYLALAGCLTDQCVESAVRDACDLNYLVTLITDACATYSQERHDNSLRAIKGYCRQRTSEQFLAEISHL